MQPVSDAAMQHSSISVDYNAWVCFMSLKLVFVEFMRDPRKQFELKCSQEKNFLRDAAQGSDTFGYPWLN